MAIPNDIVAKDSGGNIKKVDLTDLLSPYVKSEDIDGLLQDKWPASLKSASLSFSKYRNGGEPLESSFTVQAIKLTTASYGSDSIIYEQEYEVESKTIESTSDAYEFSITGTGAPFGVCSTKRCFLVLSFNGQERILSSNTVDEEECRASGAHGGNPIILDWADVTLPEGGTFNFSCNDPSRPIGVYGTLDLLRRVNQTGNIHNYDFVLKFVVCGQQAWKNLREAGSLTLKTVDTNNEIHQDDIDISAFAYPRLDGIEAGQWSATLSSFCPSILSIQNGQGISIGIDEPDPGNLSLDRKIISIGLNLEDVAGSGISIDEYGRFTVPVFSPSENEEAAAPGLIPETNGYRPNDILTASGWKSIADIGLDSATRPFSGASQLEDGSVGLVPQPLAANAGMFLRGDGTWSNAVTEISGSMECETTYVERSIFFGISLCNEHGEWILQARKCSIALAPADVAEDSFDIDIPLEDIHGISVCSPWSAKIPASIKENNGWIADKTFWTTEKTKEFSVIIKDGFLLDVWLSTKVDAENPSRILTVVHYRGHGCKTSFNRPFILSIDGIEEEVSHSLADGESVDVECSGSSIKVWPTSAKTRIIHESEIEGDSSSQSEVPWGGSIWINQERTAMLKAETLDYIGDPLNPVHVLVAYQEHPSGSPILVYGLQEQEEMWDIVLQESIVYNDAEVSSESVVGHVWRYGSDLKAASQFFANWSIQPVLQEADEDIFIPGQESSSSLNWIVLGPEAVYVPFLGLELSRPDDSTVNVRAPAVDIDSWPKEAASIDVILDAGFTGNSIELTCLKDWLNSRFEGLDSMLSDMEQRLQSAEVVFSGATSCLNGLPGLVPAASTDDRDKFLMGNGTWAELTLPDTYQGATEESDGIAGLVPAASIADRRSFLRGDGTWASAAIEGACVCTYANVKKQWTLGVNICDGDGSWLASAVKVQPSIRPNEILTYTLNLRFGADGPGGCALWNPYNATQPTNAEERTYEFYRDATVWGRGTSNHFIQTFSDGITMDCWIEVDETQTGYHNLKIAVYGPKAANVPRLVPLNVDGTNTFLTVNLAAGGTLDIPVAGNEVKIYPRPTYRTVLWRNEISEWSGNASTEPVLVTETAAEFPYLAYTVQRTETGIRIVADDYSLADWPVELASAVLNLSAGGEQTTINLGCIPAWVSNELQKIDEAIEHATSSIDSIGLYKGATENENGVAGLVPPASSAERNGTLHGDGTWGSDVVVTETMPTASDAGTVFFYIED